VSQDKQGSQVAGFYNRHIMPPLMHWSCRYHRVAKQRALVVPAAEGVVVEFGIGSGLNLPHYDPAKVARVIGVDPSPAFIKLGRRRYAASKVPVEVIEGVAEELDLEGAIADTVVVTYTLCSVKDANAALAQARRVLKPGGKLLFVEHGRAPDEAIARWQDRLTPFTRRFFGGCRLDRNMEQLIWDAGFGFERLEYHWVSRMPRTSAFLYLGTARPR
jgi:ubiquinone/menaquinone biosynthesis C-methylase UbiE